MQRFSVRAALLMAVAAGMLAANSAFAQGWFGGGMGVHGLSPDQWASRQREKFQASAKLLGVSVQEVTAAWAAGKTLDQLALEKGIPATQLRERIQTAKAEAMRANLKLLVDQGVITQAQAEQRLQWFQKVRPGKGMGQRHGMHFTGW